MVVVRLGGGLGNQMFQYAFGFAQARRAGTKFMVDVRDFADNKPHLLRIVPNLPIATVHDMEWGGNTLVMRAWGVLAKTLPRLVPIRTQLCVEPHFHFSEDLTQISGSGYYTGNFQSEKYFCAYQDEIRTQFLSGASLRKDNENTLDEIASGPSVALHVRRGDYFEDSETRLKHGVCPLEYYVDALRYVDKHVGPAKIFVFSDDPHWVVQHMSGEHLQTNQNIVHVDNNRGDNSYMDMWLMAHCNHQIIANSTFSWWGAWLNPHPDKVVVAPMKWFDQCEHDTRDIAPKDWVRL